MTSYFKDHNTYNDPVPEGHYECERQVKTRVTLEPKKGSTAVWIHTYIDDQHVGSNLLFSGPHDVAVYLSLGEIVFTGTDPRTDRQKDRGGWAANLKWAESGDAVYMI